MRGKEYIVVVGAGLHGADPAFLDHPGLTASLDLSPPRIDFTLRKEPMMPDLDVRMLREPKRRDWEQRERKRRRKP